MTARTPNAARGLLLAAGVLALIVTALLLLVVGRLARTREASASLRARCECCEETPR